MYNKQDRISQWTRYRSDLCNQCIAACCKMPVEITREDIRNLQIISEIDGLSDKKIAKILQERKIIKNYRAATGLFLIQEKADGSCYFLVNNRCTVYQKRPQVCRKFPIEVGNRLGFCPFVAKN